MHNDQTRLRRLNKILEKLSSGQSVQNRALQAWLTADEYKNYENRLTEQSDLRSLLKTKPFEVVKYERLLERAVLLDARINRYKGKAAYDASTMAQAACERALEYLIEADISKVDLELWLDRPIDYSPGGENSADPNRLPIPITSKSLKKRPNTGYLSMLCSKRELKIAAVEAAIENLQRPNDDRNETEDALVKTMRKRSKALSRSNL